MPSEKEVEAEIKAKGLKAPRLSPADVDAAIKGETFTRLPSGKCLVCELTLQNGFTVRGEASVVRPENFDQEIGEKIARDDARKKIWPLLAYELQTRHPA